MVKELLNYDLVVGFKAKDDVVLPDEHDKRHIRIMAILRLAKEGKIEEMITHKFKEGFLFDKEERIAYYCVKYIRERKDQKCRQSLVN